MTTKSEKPPSMSTFVATVIRNWLEFFDFGVYAFFAVMIGKVFFVTEGRRRGRRRTGSCVAAR